MIVNIEYTAHEWRMVPAVTITSTPLLPHSWYHQTPYVLVME